VRGGACSILGGGWGWSSRWRRGYAGRVVFLQRQVLYGSVNVCVLQVFQIEESLPS